jgi:hypothetical protein
MTLASGWQPYLLAEANVMSEQRTEQYSAPRLDIKVAVADDKHGSVNPGEEVKAPGSDRPRENEQAAKARTVAPEKLRRQSRLPALDDDADVGVEKEHIVTRDGKADLIFTGTLLASAAPAAAPKGTWQEYRIYHTHNDKHVFSKVTRNVLEDKDDAYEAEVFDPTPSTVQSQVMRAAREIARSRPMTWMDAAVAFFGYDPLAKALYRKLSVRFEERIS